MSKGGKEEGISGGIAGLEAFVVCGDWRRSDANAGHTFVDIGFGTRGYDGVAAIRKGINHVANPRKDTDRTVDTVSFDFPSSLNILLDGLLLVSSITSSRTSERRRAHKGRVIASGLNDAKE